MIAPSLCLGFPCPHQEHKLGTGAAEPSRPAFEATTFLPVYDLKEVILFGPGLHGREKAQVSMWLVWRSSLCWVGLALLC